MAKRPLAVAVTGGIAAGKSEALASFARHGAATLSADALVHELLANDEEVRAAIRERWGEEAVGDRKRIGEIVFGARAELDWLERLLHPKTRAAADAWISSVDARVAVVEVPLLYETGGESRFDAVVVVTAPSDVRASRRGGFADREARLVPDGEKVARADFAFVNDGSLEELDAFVADVMAHAGGARREDREVAAALALEPELRLHALHEVLVGDAEVGALGLPARVGDARELLVAERVERLRLGRVVAVDVDDHFVLASRKSSTRAGAFSSVWSFTGMSQ